MSDGWEQLVTEPSASVTSRLAIEGGWLYRVETIGPVPDPTMRNPEAISFEVTHVALVFVPTADPAHRARHAPR